MKPGQRIRHAGILHMAVGVDAEEVVAQVLSGGPGFDPAEVDAPGGELVQDFHQRTRPVLGQRDHNGGLIRARPPGQDAGTAHEDEPRYGTRVVANVLCQNGQARLFLRDDRCADRGVVGGVLLPTAPWLRLP